MPSIKEIRARFPNLGKLPDSEIANIYASAEGIDAVTAAYELGIEPVKKPGLLRGLADTGVDVATGLMEIPRSMAGLAGVIPGVSEVADPIRRGIEWSQKGLRENLQTDYQLQKARELQEAMDKEGILESAGGAVDYLRENPDQLVNIIAGSVVPSLVGGRAYLAAGEKALGYVAPQLAGRLAGASTASRAMGGEGLMAGGSVSADIAERGGDHWDRALGIPAGVATGMVSGASGAIGRRFGAGNIDELLAGGKQADLLTRHTPMYRRVPAGFAAEAGEEAIQSPSEQIFTNLGTDQTWSQGIGGAGVIGAASGGIMGGGMSLRRRPGSYTQDEVQRAQEVLSQPTTAENYQAKVQAAQWLSRVEGRDRPEGLSGIAEQAEQMGLMAQARRRMTKAETVDLLGGQQTAAPSAPTLDELLRQRGVRGSESLSDLEAVQADMEARQRVEMERLGRERSARDSGFIRPGMIGAPDQNQPVEPGSWFPRPAPDPIFNQVLSSGYDAITTGQVGEGQGLQPTPFIPTLGEKTQKGAQGPGNADVNALRRAWINLNKFLQDGDITQEEFDAVKPAPKQNLKQAVKQAKELAHIAALRAVRKQLGVDPNQQWVYGPQDVREGPAIDENGVEDLATAFLSAKSEGDFVMSQTHLTNLIEVANIGNDAQRDADVDNGMATPDAIAYARQIVGSLVEQGQVGRQEVEAGGTDWGAFIAGVGASLALKAKGLQGEKIAAATVEKQTEVEAPVNRDLFDPKESTAEWTRVGKSKGITTWAQQVPDGTRIIKEDAQGRTVEDKFVPRNPPRKATAEQPPARKQVMADYTDAELENMLGDAMREVQQLQGALSAGFGEDEATAAMAAVTPDPQRQRSLQARIQMANARGAEIAAEIERRGGESAVKEGPFKQRGLDFDGTVEDTIPTVGKEEFASAAARAESIRRERTGERSASEAGLARERFEMLDEDSQESLEKHFEEDRANYTGRSGWFRWLTDVYTKANGVSSAKVSDAAVKIIKRALDMDVDIGRVQTSRLPFQVFGLEGTIKPETKGDVINTAMNWLEYNEPGVLEQVQDAAVAMKRNPGGLLFDLLIEDPSVMGDDTLALQARLAEVDSEGNLKRLLIEIVARSDYKRMTAKKASREMPLNSADRKFNVQMQEAMASAGITPEMFIREAAVDAVKDPEAANERAEAENESPIPTLAVVSGSSDGQRAAVHFTYNPDGTVRTAVLVTNLPRTPQQVVNEVRSGVQTALTEDAAPDTQVYTAWARGKTTADALREMESVFKPSRPLIKPMPSTKKDLQQATKGFSEDVQRQVIESAMLLNMDALTLLRRMVSATAHTKPKDAIDALMGLAADIAKKVARPPSEYTPQQLRQLGQYVARTDDSIDTNSQQELMQAGREFALKIWAANRVPFVAGPWEMDLDAVTKLGGQLLRKEHTSAQPYKPSRFREMMRGLSELERRASKAGQYSEESLVRHFAASMYNLGRRMRGLDPLPLSEYKLEIAPEASSADITGLTSQRRLPTTGKRRRSTTGRTGETYIQLNPITIAYGRSGIPGDYGLFPLTTSALPSDFRGEQPEGVEQKMSNAEALEQSDQFLKDKRKAERKARAVQKPSAAEVDVRKQAGNGETVAEGDTEKAAAAKAVSKAKAKGKVNAAKTAEATVPTVQKETQPVQPVPTEGVENANGQVVPARTEKAAASEGAEVPAAKNVKTETGKTAKIPAELKPLVRLNDKGRWVLSKPIADDALRLRVVDLLADLNAYEGTAEEVSDTANALPIIQSVIHQEVTKSEREALEEAGHTVEEITADVANVLAAKDTGAAINKAANRYGKLREMVKKMLSRIVAAALSLVTAVNLSLAPPAISEANAAIRHMKTQEAVKVVNADFGDEVRTAGVEKLAASILTYNIHGGKPFVIADKPNAKSYVFDADGKLQGATATLLGKVKRDKLVTKPLSQTKEEDRITPSGIFTVKITPYSAYGTILSLDNSWGVAMHRVDKSTPSEKREQRLNTASTADNRISWGCLNVPDQFYDGVISTTFANTTGTMYIMPDSMARDSNLGLPVAEDRDAEFETTVSDTATEPDRQQGDDGLNEKRRGPSARPRKTSLKSVTDTVENPTTVKNIFGAMREWLGLDTTAGATWNQQKLLVVQSLKDLDANTRILFAAPGVQGIAWEGERAVIVADRVEVGTELAVLLHEVGEHVGLSGLIGEENIPKLVAKIDQMGKGGTKAEREAVAAAKRRIPKDTNPKDMKRELIAYTAEELLKRGIKPSSRAGAHALGAKFLSAIMRFVTDAINKVLGTNKAQLTGEELLDILQASAAKTLTGLPTLTGPSEKNVMFSFRGDAADRISDMQTNALSVAKKGIKMLAFSHTLERMAKGVLDSADEFFNTWGRRDQMKNEIEDKAQRILHKLSNGLAAKYKGKDLERKFAELSGLLSESTKTRKWMFQPSWDAEAKVDTEMAAKFDAFHGGNKDIEDGVKEMFQFGADTYQQARKFLEASIIDEYKAEIDATTDANEKAKLVKERDKALSDVLQKRLPPKMPGPFVPLRRFGEHIVIMKSDAFKDAQDRGDEEAMNKMISEGGDHYIVRMFDSEAAAKRFEEQLKKDGYANVKRTKKIENLDQLDRYPWQGIEKIISGIRTSDASNQNKQALRKIALDLYTHSVAEATGRRSNLRRKGTFDRSGVEGEGDMIRAFAEYSQGMAGFLSALQFGKQMSEQLTSMKSEAHAGDSEAVDLYNEIAARYAQSLNQRPNPLVGKIQRVTSAMMLSLSPSYYAVNATQPWMFGLPMLGGRFGWNASRRELSKATSDVWGALKWMPGQDLEISKISGLSTGDREVLQHLYNVGKLTIGLNAELGKWSSTGTPGNNVVGKTLAFTDNLMIQTEFLNRAATALAAHRLATKTPGLVPKGMSPGAYAETIVDDTQGNYASSNASRIFNTDVGKVMLQFRKYQLIQITLLTGLAVKALKKLPTGTPAEIEAAKNERAVAAKALSFLIGQHLAVTGIGGTTPDLFMKLMAAGLGDDDKDWERNARKALGSDEAFNLMFKGIPAALGLDVSKRIGIQNAFSLLPFSEGIVPADRKGAEKAVIAALGPGVALGLNQYDALATMLKGDYWKGAEKLMPKGFKEAARAMRFYNEGITSTRGDVRLTPEELSAIDLAAQAVGLPTMKITDYNRTQGDIYELNDHFKNKATRLRDRYSKAFRENDAAEMVDLRTEWMELQAAKRRWKDELARQGFKDKTLLSGINPQPLSTLLKAPKEQLKRERQWQ